MYSWPKARWKLRPKIWCGHDRPYLLPSTALISAAPPKVVHRIHLEEGGTDPLHRTVFKAAQDMGYSITVHSRASSMVTRARSITSKYRLDSLYGCIGSRYHTRLRTVSLMRPEERCCFSGIEPSRANHKPVALSKPGNLVL